MGLACSRALGITPITMEDSYEADHAPRPPIKRRLRLAFRRGSESASGPALRFFIRGNRFVSREPRR
jgi:hypothetical protein